MIRKICLCSTATACCYKIPTLMETSATDNDVKKLDSGEGLWNDVTGSISDNNNKSNKSNFHTNNRNENPNISCYLPPPPPICIRQPKFHHNHRDAILQSAGVAAVAADADADAAMARTIATVPPCFLLNHHRYLPIPHAGVSAWFPFFSWFQLQHLHLKNHFHMPDDPNHPNVRPPPPSTTNATTAATAISSCRFRGINRTHCESSSPQPPRTLHQKPPDNSRGTSQSLSSSVSIASSSSSQQQQQLLPSSSSRTWDRWWMYMNPFRSSSSSSVWDMWKLDASVLVQRQHDEMVAQQILQQLQTNQRMIQQQRQETLSTPTHYEQLQEQIRSLQQEWIQTVFGPNITTIQERQEFIEQYGCTGWTDDVLDYLLQLGSSSSSSPQHHHYGHRGYIEIGAGNGQWAQILTDRYEQQQLKGNHLPLSQQQQQQQQQQPRRPLFNFVLAYDDMSALPLHPIVYKNKRKKNNHDSTGVVTPVVTVRPLINHSIDATIRQWICRGRILLLVYPPSMSDMAYCAVKAYDEVHGNDPTTEPILVYIGEGRNGMNGNQEFFDYIEDPKHHWSIRQVMNVRSFGSKGYEKMYVLTKTTKQSLHPN
jgi:hypothetical protein